jgi:hypothetical protein
VIILILKLAAVYLMLALAVYLLGRFVHNYLYTEIPEDLYWTAPAAAGVIWLAGLAMPLAINGGANPEAGRTKWPVAFNDFFLFDVSRTEVEFEAFDVVGERGRTIRYTRTGPRQYRDEENNPFPTGSPPLAIDGVTKEEERIRFEVVRDVQGGIDRGTAGRPLPVRYRDDQGQVMPLDELGEISSSRWGQVFLSLFGLLVIVAVWFAVLWLLLHLSPTHALVVGLGAALLWAVVLQFVPLS